MSLDLTGGDSTQVGSILPGAAVGAPSPTVAPAEGGQPNVSVTPSGGEPNDPAKKSEAKPTGLAGLGKGSPGKTNEPQVPPPYQPNFKVRVMDKEYEVEDWLRSAIKNPEHEKRAKELYSAIHGIDSIKQDRQTLKSELAETKEKVARTDQALEAIGGFARANDWDSFFEVLNIPKQQILQYALQLVQREQDPAIKAQWEANRTATNATRHYETQSRELAVRQQQVAVQQRTFELDTTLSKPEIMSVSQAYDAGMENPGAFREFVIRIGQAHAASGKDISATEAVTEAIKHLRAVNPSMGQTAPAAPQSPQVVAPSNKPVLPNMGGRGTSPVRPVIKTFDDLKNRSKELNGGSGF